MENIVMDFIPQFAHTSLAKLIEVPGVTRKIPMQEGTTMYTYTTAGTLQSGAVDEGKVIPLSQYQRNKKLRLDTPAVFRLIYDSTMIIRIPF